MTQVATSILLVEDDRLIALDARLALQEIGYEKIIVHHSADDAIYEITTQGLPDIALLDIDLGVGKRSGFDVAKVLNRLGEVLIIFWTAHPQKFRQQATMKHSLFLEKNTAPETLAHNISLLANAASPHQATPLQHIYLSYRFKHSELVSKVPTKEIIFMAADQSRVDFYTLQRTYKGIGRTLTEFENKTFFPNFFRIHHKYTVHLEIPKRKTLQDGREIQIIEPLELPISRRQQPLFRKFWMSRS